MKNNGWKIAVVILASLCFLLVAATVVVTLGLGGGVGEVYSKKTDGAGMAPEMVEEAYDMTDQSTEAAPAQIERQIIVNASLSLDVKKLSESVAKTEAMVEKNGGYVESASFTTGSDASRQATLVIRVPAKKFDATMAKLRGMAAGVGDESVSRADVTMEYVDIEARLKNMQQHEKALQELWTKAKSVEDMIKIEGELARVQGEIESLSAQKKVMENQIQLATINLYLYEQPSSLPANAKGEGVFQQAGDALVKCLQLIKYTAGLLVIVVVGLSPLIVLGVVIFLIVRLVIKRRKLNKAKVAKGDPS